MVVIDIVVVIILWISWITASVAELTTLEARPETNSKAFTVAEISHSILWRVCFVRVFRHSVPVQVVRTTFVMVPFVSALKQKKRGQCDGSGDGGRRRTRGQAGRRGERPQEEQRRQIDIEESLSEEFFKNEQSFLSCFRHELLGVGRQRRDSTDAATSDITSSSPLTSASGSGRSEVPKYGNMNSRSLNPPRTFRTKISYYR